MKSFRVLVAVAIAGCAEGMTPAVEGIPVGSSADDAEEQELGEAELPAPDLFAWSVDVDPGSSHRLAVVGEGALVLAASRERVELARFDSEGVRVWSSDVPQIFGGGPVEIGSARDGDIAVVGADAGQLRWTTELVGDWGLVQARGVAVHASGAVAVLAQEFADGREVRTIVEFFAADGHREAREVFSQPKAAAAMIADQYGFVAVGDAGANDLYPQNTWIRGYALDGLLDDAAVIGVGLTGVWVRENEVTKTDQAWIGGIVSASLSCLLPALAPSDLEMKESPTATPLAMTPTAAVLAIEEDRVLLYPPAGDPRAYTPAAGTPTTVAVGRTADDPIFVLSHDDATDTTRLHRLVD
jgi:hypothetical protein